MRLKDSNCPEFAEFLLRVGDGTAEKYMSVGNRSNTEPSLSNSSTNKILLPHYIKMTNSLDSLINFVYGP